MLKEVIAALLIVVLLVLALALRSLFAGDKNKLDRSFQLRVGLSILLIAFILVAYSLGLIEVSPSVQFL